MTNRFKLHNFDEEVLILGTDLKAGKMVCVQGRTKDHRRSRGKTENSPHVPM